MAASERIFTLLDTPVSVVSPASPKRAEWRGHVTFDHVWFAYDGEHYVLQDVSSRCAPVNASASSAPPGRARARSSTCCCGTTTSQGRILVDGVDIREIDLGELRKRLAWCCRTSTCSRARLAGTCGWGTRDWRGAGAAGPGGGARRPLRRRDGARRRRSPSAGRRVNGAEAVAVVCAGAGFRPANPRADEATSSIDTETNC